MRTVFTEFHSIIDIALVSVIIYRILWLLTGTRAIQLIKGLIILVCLSTLSSFLRLRLLSWFIGNALLALSFAVPIVFQPELRKMLEELGSSIFNSTKQSMSHQKAQALSSHVSRALLFLKAHRIGALLVLQQNVGLADYYNSAVKINSSISQELIISIFWKDNPLHDGALILNRSSIIAGSCYLPLADDPQLSRWFGTRHRAALGISELSDALVFVVSEERGLVTLAHKGRLSSPLKDFQIERLLFNYFSGGRIVSGWKARFKALLKLFWQSGRTGSSGGTPQ